MHFALGKLPTGEYIALCCMGLTSSSSSWKSAINYILLDNLVFWELSQTLSTKSLHRLHKIACAFAGVVFCLFLVKKTKSTGIGRSSSKLQSKDVVRILEKADSGMVLLLFLLFCCFDSRQLSKEKEWRTVEGAAMVDVEGKASSSSWEEEDGVR